MDGPAGKTSSTPISLDHIQTYIHTQVSNLTDMLNEEYTKLAEERKKLEKDKQSFYGAHKIISSFKDPIKLNVGGTIFMTSKSTLQNKESMLSAMFSGRHTLEKGEDGAYFIDRDAKHFGKILNFLRDGQFEVPKDEQKKNEILREAEYYSMPALIDYLSGARKQELLRFDTTRKGGNVVLNDTTASNKTDEWQPAFTSSFSKGVHSCTFEWKNISTKSNMYIMIGVAGANINHAASNMYTQPQSMLWYNHGSLYVDGKKQKNTVKYAQGIVTVELDCDKRLVTWINGTNRFTEPIHDNLQAPFSFCVDLYGSEATITAIH